MPRVIIPPPYRGPTEGTAEVLVEGETVLDCLEAVERKYPGFLPQVLTPDGSVHRFVKVFRNGEQIEGRALEVRVDARDEIQVIASIAGG